MRGVCRDIPSRTMSFSASYRTKGVLGSSIFLLRVSIVWILFLYFLYGAHLLAGEGAQDSPRPLLSASSPPSLNSARPLQCLSIPVLAAMFPHANSLPPHGCVLRPHGPVACHANA